MLKHYFLVYKKKHYDLLAFETHDRMHKNIFFFFSKFFLYFGSFDENRVF